MAGPLFVCYDVCARQRCRACSTSLATMKTTALAASPGGDPFASELDRALWELGYPNDFDTEAEAQGAIEELCRERPEFRALSFNYEVV